MKKILALIYFLSFILSSFGQEEKIVVIDRGSGKTYKEKKERIIVDSKSVMKYSPLQMIVGEINFGYERKIDELSSIEIEFGPTLSNIGLTVSDNHFNDPFGGGSYVGETSKLGLFGSVGYRFYPMDNGKVLNGFYVSPVVKYRIKNFGVHDYSDLLPDTKGSENHMYFTFNFGVQRWLSENFSLDMFGGIGLGYESHMRFNTATTYDGNTGIYSYYWDKKSFDGVRFVLTGGVKIGIGR